MNIGSYNMLSVEKTVVIKISHYSIYYCRKLLTLEFHMGMLTHISLDEVWHTLLL